ncbi:MAG: FAD-binding oxidoreductase, partial [Pseudomonadota bacterium]
CLGLEAVLPDGQILHGLSRLRKDNTGYDLRHLLIGSEGTLGIITAASLKLFPRPRERVVALLAVASPAAALALLNRVRDQVGEALSAFEILAETSFAFLAETMPTLPRPFDTQPAWAVLLEVGSGEGSALEARLLPALEAAMEAGEVVDALIAQNEAQATDFWTLRESVPEANRKIGAIASHDISVPISRLPDFIAKARSALLREVPELRINCFGHVGDGNLHYNLFPPQGGSGSDFDTDRSRLTAIVHDLAHALGGSVSAEHGIGRLKRGDLAQYGDPAKLSTMRAIKAALDPLGIMNPGALFSDP